MPNDTDPPRRGYPLSALFLVLTGCAMIAALVAPAMRGILAGTVGAKEALVAAVASSVLVMALGGIVGLFHFHRGRGFCWGLVTGSVIGMAAGPMVVAPHAALGSMLGLALGGTVVILLCTMAFRLAGRST